MMNNLSHIRDYHQNHHVDRMNIHHNPHMGILRDCTAFPNLYQGSFDRFRRAAFVGFFFLLFIVVMTQRLCLCGIWDSSFDIFFSLEKESSFDRFQRIHALRRYNHVDNESYIKQSLLKAAIQVASEQRKAQSVLANIAIDTSGGGSGGAPADLLLPQLLASSPQIQNYDDIALSRIAQSNRAINNTSGGGGSAQTQTPPASTSPWNYDVFLSFRGEDTRRNFTDHLYTCLTQAGIRTFGDDDELRRGNEISAELLKAISESQISIIVFSKNYAYSRWCLDELLHILECKESKGQLVIPLFYDVDPSTVRNQTASYAAAFVEHERRFEAEKVKVAKWRGALTEAGDLAGWHLGNQSEAMFIKTIVQEIARQIKYHMFQKVAEHPIGLEYRVEKITSQLSINTNDVRIVGIYGMGGIGKTTLVKDVYNKVSRHFDSCCYLEDVREACLQPNGLVRLQEQLLSSLLKQVNFKVDSESLGRNLIRRRLNGKKVLVIIDDLGDQEQLDSLAGSLDWFGPGSRIIVTTRNLHLLHDVERKYEAEKLDEEESLQLFSCFAFGRLNPPEDYKQLSKKIISYVDGLPLALKVLGSHLRGETVAVWTSECEKLKKIPKEIFFDKLKISYDGLDDDKVKALFLDIACFFVGSYKENTQNILDNCGLFAESGMRALENRCLLSIDNFGFIRMHDLVRDMGREIVRRESPDEPGKRSRLWNYEEICDVLKNEKGTKSIEGISIVALRPKDPAKVSKFFKGAGEGESIRLDTRNEMVKLVSEMERLHWRTEAFKKMVKLRLLRIDHAHLSGNFSHMPKDLIWLSWKYCPLSCLPSDFSLGKLAVMDMEGSQFKIHWWDILLFRKFQQIWRGQKVLSKLKILEIVSCHWITRTPDFSQLPLLEMVSFRECLSLYEIHPSIGDLGRLWLLDLSYCMELSDLPTTFSKLKSLEELKLACCIKLQQCLPVDVIGSMENLRLFDAYEAIPKYLQPRNSIQRLKLKWLDLGNNKLSEEDIAFFDIGSFSLLEYLDLSGNNFRSLPPGISQLSKLTELRFSSCPKLVSLSNLPLSLMRLVATKCALLQKVDLSNFQQLPEDLDFSQNKALTEIEGLDRLGRGVHINLQGCSRLRLTITTNFLRGEDKSYEIQFPMSIIPGWFRIKRDGSSMSFRWNDAKNYVGITLWAVYSTYEDDSPNLGVDGRVDVKVTNQKTPISFVANQILKDHSWVFYLPKDLYLKLASEESIIIKVEFVPKCRSGRIEIKKCGAHAW